mmetsp:Transcript_23246/g.45843  ORF Transcript_23246/g.45843 Transcript_23246/m.45843 type:complete len:841 (+) Transcript_23246:50-2572(+)|eukprot:CAMPEP_0175150016 /NCGR_PEP_ID=MMETSP0087-20121206/17605_1 /TAXON_ID=136419 /ORGANISM="Unknown Unknown, Strain D1" /LENGTH=840 /DNA_ID=CAMNT_0016435853 /DNA_START=48 /DNA_END=2570 /DNA_ORIENTATION=+
MAEGNSIFAALEKENTNPILKYASKAWNHSFSPYGKLHTVWDVILLFLILFTSFWEPYQCAYFPQEYGLSTVEWFIDGLFYFDILFTFWTSYDSGAGMVTDKGLIAKEYLSFWFWPDILATVQLDLVAREIVYASRDYSSEADMRAVTITPGTAEFNVRLFRLFKILRLLRVGRLVDRLTAAWTSHTGFVSAGKFFLYVFYVAHMLACTFYMIPDVLALGLDVDSWRRHGGDFDITQAPHWQKYLQSLYFAFTTMTTIGYGDRLPKNVYEITFVCFAEVFGLMFFALLLTEINNVNDVLGKGTIESNAIKNEVVGFIKSRGMPPGLILTVNKFLRFRTTSRAAAHDKSFDPIFNNLTPSLRREIHIAVLKPSIMKVPMFGWEPTDMQERARTRKLFDKIDVDKSDEIDVGEMSTLMAHLDAGNLLTKEPCLKQCLSCLKKKKGHGDGEEHKEEEVTEEEEEEIEVTDDHKERAAKAMAEIDKDGGGEVSYIEFSDWWYLKKDKKPRLPQAPKSFIDTFCSSVHVTPYSPGDIIVEAGSYGAEFHVLLQGSIVVVQEVREEAEKLKDGSEEEDKDEAVTQLYYTDRDPVFGVVGVLPANQRRLLDQVLETDTRVVRAAPDYYCDMVHLDASEVKTIIEEHWPELVGERLWQFARYYYGLVEHPDVPEEMEVDENPQAVHVAAVSSDFYVRELDRREKKLEEVGTTVAVWQEKIAKLHEHMQIICDKVIGTDDQDLADGKEPEQALTVDPDMDSGGVILNLPIPVYQSSSSVAAGQAPVAAEGGAGTVVINNKVVQLNPAVPGYEAVSKSFLTHTPEIPDSPESISSLVPSRNDLDDDELKF